MKRLILSISLLFFSTSLLACSCFISRDPVSVRDYNAMPFIVSGTVKEIIIRDSLNIDHQKQIVFEVNEVFKGSLKDKVINIYTAFSDASCGLFVQKGETWIIWAYMQQGVLTTNLCTRSLQTKYVSEADLKTLRMLRSSPESLIWKNEKGIIIAEGKLENQKPVGYWKYYYKNGHIEMEGNYLNEQFHGKWLSYLDPEGIITRWKYDKKIPEDSMPELNGITNRIHQIRHYKNGKPDGDFIYFGYTSIDKPSSFRQYKDGKENGKSIAYYENGLIHYEQNYLNGHRHGVERIYYVNGQLQKEGRFADGKLIGAYKYFDESGNPIAKAGQ